jgi:hypothetical protein
MSDGKHRHESATEITVAVIQGLDLKHVGIPKDENLKDLNQVIQEVYTTAIKLVKDNQ